MGLLNFFIKLLPKEELGKVTGGILALQNGDALLQHYIASHPFSLPYSEWVKITEKFQFLGTNPQAVFSDLNHNNYQKALSAQKYLYNACNEKLVFQEQCMQVNQKSLY